jgi:hypothetical protein
MTRSGYHQVRNALTALAALATIVMIFLMEAST